MNYRHTSVDKLWRIETLLVSAAVASFGAGLLAGPALAAEAVVPWSVDMQQPAMSSASVEGASGEGTLFAEIGAAGPDNACYPDSDHFAAEFLFQNPEVCLWDVDVDQRRVFALPVPVPPGDAIRLPAPSGGDDTQMLEAIINGNPGRSVVGSGRYTVSGMEIRVPIDIHDMPMRAGSRSSTVIRVRAPDVRIFRSPIDAEGSTTVATGFAVDDEALRFTLIQSGFSNARQRLGKSVTGVYLRGAVDFHLACNRFDNIINQTSNRSLTARANAIWMNGGSRERASGGVIANNVASNLQSNGEREDAEFLTVQSFTSTDAERPLRVFGNRVVDAGKRFTKHQESDALVLSNAHEWATGEGPIGRRRMLSHVSVHGGDNVIVRNNRVRIGAGARFDYAFITRAFRRSTPQDNVHYDCNDIELTEVLDPNSGSRPHLFVARADGRNGTAFEATNSSANYNRVHGVGAVSNYYWFGDGYRILGGRFETAGNEISVPYRRTEYKGR